MEEEASALLKPVARIILTVAKSLLWLSWELIIQTIGWSIGWVVCRLVSFGTFPKERVSGIDDALWFVALIVEIIGLVFLVCMVNWLNGFVNG